MKKVLICLMLCLLTCSLFAISGFAEENGAPKKPTSEGNYESEGKILEKGVTATPDMNEAAGAGVKTDVKVDAPYTVDPDPNSLTISVVDLTEWNTSPFLVAKKMPEEEQKNAGENDPNVWTKMNTDYYYTASIPKKSAKDGANNPPITIKLYSKAKPGEVVEAITVNPGDEHLTFNTLMNKYNEKVAQEYKKKYNEDLPEDIITAENIYFNYNLDGVPTLRTSPIRIISKVISNFTLPGRKNMNVNAEQVVIPKVTGLVTSYRAIDPDNPLYDDNKNDAKTDTYKPNGKETDIATHKIYGHDGEVFTPSNPREFSDYILYQQSPETGKGKKINTLPVGTKWQDHGFNNRGVKRIREIISEDQTQRISVWVKNPSKKAWEGQDDSSRILYKDATDISTDGYTKVFETEVPSGKANTKVLPNKTFTVDGQTFTAETNNKNSHSSISNLPEGKVLTIYTGDIKDPVTNTMYGGTVNTLLTNDFHPSEEVVHYYVKAGKVVVNYVDEKGNVIKEQVEDTPKSKVGTNYDTAVDNRPDKIEKDGKVYERVPAKTTGKENGKVIGGTTVVTYVYREVQKEEPPAPKPPKPEPPKEEPPAPQPPKEEPKKPETPKANQPKTNAPKAPERKKANTPNTGDDNMLYVLSLIGIASAVGILLIGRRQNKEGKLL